MKIAWLAINCLLISSATFGQNVDKVTSPVDYVNPLMGTDSKPELSNGNTYPVIGRPWGMNYWTPQTGLNGNGWQYTHNEDQIRGFKQTHQPSPWMNDYGVFSIMPVVGQPVFEQHARATGFSHRSEIAKPYYYSVYMHELDVSAEIAPTERAAMFRFIFPKTDSAYIVLDAFSKGSYVKIIPDEHKIVGYSQQYARGKLTNFKNYFVIVFDRPFKSVGTWSDSTMQSGNLTKQDKHVGAIVGFKPFARGAQLHVKVASSFISEAQAELNLKELGNEDFNTIRDKGKAAWNKALGRIDISGGSIDQVRTFYSCLYRTMLFPNKLYEYDAAGKIMHYSPYNGKVLPGYMFAGTGFWDTFRALYPFLNLMYPSINKEMQQGLLNDYLEGDFLPEWSSPGFADIMVGNNSASVVAEAYIKGLRGYDIDKLYEALVHGANHEGPVSAVGRKGVDYYNRLGYVPYDVKINENAARTLEYAYDDFAIYQLAKALKRPQAEIDTYANRSMNYKNLFSKEYNLMRGRNEDGSFQSPFNPFKWGDAFTEGNSWHYTWSVFHDVQGLIDLMGGKKQFIKMLDSVFVMPPVFDDSYYGGTIHEIREMQIPGMGQYAHGNQPAQHMLYLYNYAGQPWKGQYWIREALNRLYRATPDGYCGDEDNGQTSAWYVFSALGFYPVCPASGEYVMGAPLFKKAVLSFENGKTLTIDAPANSDENRYVGSLHFMNRNYPDNWVSHTDMQQGGSMLFGMSSTPNRKRGIANATAPYSFATAAQHMPSYIVDEVAASKQSGKDAPGAGAVGDYHLLYVDADTVLSAQTIHRMLDVFKVVYPKQVEKYNPAALKKINMIIDPTYTGVAETDNGTIRVNPQWMIKHPEDIDIMTHEFMHIVQAYPDDAGPGWITEGIADYVRYEFGVNNEAAGWSLPAYNPKQHYTDAYRVTARFFVWIEKHQSKGLVKKLDKAMRTKAYTDAFWKQTTGKTVEELWGIYTANPTL